MQVDRLLLHSLDRLHLKWCVEILARLWQLAIVRVKTWYDFIQINQAVLRHQLLHLLERSELLELEGEHRFADSGRLLNIRALRAVHSG